MRRHEQAATPHLALALPTGVLHYLVCFYFLFIALLPSFPPCFPSHSFTDFFYLLLFFPVRMLTTEPSTSTDDDILVKMGSVREGKTDEEKESYFAGLKEIINDLRRDKVKDFNTVASEIAAYRRRFLQDPSRVLSL